MALKTKRNIVVFGELKEYDCYTVVTRLNGSKETMNITLEHKKSDNHEIIMQSTMYEFKPNVDDNAENFIKQAYLYLKSLPEYINATDC